MCEGKNKAPDIRIFVACHRPTYILDNPLLVPVQVGASLTDARYKGMRYDDEGDNISNQNREYCELTAQYWAWKNVECDYYGFFHYRRYLSFDKVFPVGKDGALRGAKRQKPYLELDDIREDLTPYRLNPDWMTNQIVRYDLMTVFRERINTTVYRQYCQFHPKESLDRIVDILKHKYPEYGPAAERYLNSKEIYYMNMYIMKKDIFLYYMGWLFDILHEFEKEDAYRVWQGVEPRLMGYLAERLFGIFYTYQRTSGALCAELPYLRFYDTEIHRGEGHQKNIRVFRLKRIGAEIKIDMRKVNRFFPAGTWRRVLLRNLFLK